MDFQDILFLLIFLVFSFLPKKKKIEVKEEENEVQSERVRKKIEALKRKRIAPSLEENVGCEGSTLSVFLEDKQNDFLAYKQVFPTYEMPVVDSKEVKKNTSIGSKSSYPSNTLRERMKWHIILSQPVCNQFFYGNFTNR